jgi:glucosyl-3-phosphoglycerate synthase|tara:strand:+ start:98 stop:1366 length:1269 start_codon:yes stop_codon:yes gene_type:complete
LSDFFQNGIVTTLHNLKTRSLQSLEEELHEFSEHSPMALILPCLYSELAQDALSHIIDTLNGATYLAHVVIGLDQATESEYRHALEYFSRLKITHTVLWNDGPRASELQDKLKQHNVAPTDLGKGCNVWYCFGFIQSLPDIKVVALHDCDITTYDRALLARLLYPVANPQFNYQFCKGFYARVAEGKLNGRVSRLLVSPLLRSMKRVFPEQSFLEYLDSFRYPLAGEFAMRIDLVKTLRIPADWALEIGLLTEVFRNYSTKQVCQIEVADNYDHKHQALSADDRSRGLSRMSSDIATSLYRILATFGAVFETGTVRTVKAAYLRIALDLIESYYNDAMVNGLHFDRDAEERAVEAFATNVLISGQEYLQTGQDLPYVPSWNRVTSVYPSAPEQLAEIVALDYEEFGNVGESNRRAAGSAGLG